MVGGTTILVAVEEIITAEVVGALGAIGAVSTVVAGAVVWIWMLELTVAVFTV